MNRSGRKLIDLYATAYTAWANRDKNGKFKRYNLDGMATAMYQGQQVRVLWGGKLVWGTLTNVVDRGFNGVDIQFRTKSGELRMAPMKNAKIWG